MIARLPLALALASALVHVASAQLQVLSPGGDNLWWVADNENLLVWNCNESQEQTFTVLVNNPNMASALAIIAEQPNYVCSLLVTKDQMGGLPVGTGYVVQLANPLNGTDVYAQSSAFEIKAAGSAYPVLLSPRKVPRSLLPALDPLALLLLPVATRLLPLMMALRSKPLWALLSLVQFWGCSCSKFRPCSEIRHFLSSSFP
ncbi:hypothetical protein C8R41DRAFT_520119 [Lentinula lateritia]|uniref:Uncharacterized protein n=1 Tax=Lentinula lateritia TaxID=40482 RepID=A0ABQ8V7B6_9AGAR|nr:hypothetical protein C8R41DRAFT_520119 [Lentinula lateritia]